MSPPTLDADADKELARSSTSVQASKCDTAHEGNAKEVENKPRNESPLSMTEETNIYYKDTMIVNSTLHIPKKAYTSYAKSGHAIEVIELFLLGDLVPSCLKDDNAAGISSLEAIESALLEYGLRINPFAALSAVRDIHNHGQTVIFFSENWMASSMRAVGEEKHVDYFLRLQRIEELCDAKKVQRKVQRRAERKAQRKDVEVESIAPQPMEEGHRFEKEGPLEILRFWMRKVKREDQSPSQRWKPQFAGAEKRHQEEAGRKHASRKRKASKME